MAELCGIIAMREDLIPDVSLGTHFFNDLVAMDILDPALFPGARGTAGTPGSSSSRPPADQDPARRGTPGEGGAGNRSPLGPDHCSRLAAKQRIPDLVVALARLGRSARRRA
jgi:hypothetical protein